jgi:hypothetical protein
MFRRSQFLVIAVAMVLSLIALPTAQVFAASVTSPNVSVNGCDLTLSFDSTSSSTAYEVQIWDDGVQTDSDTQSGAPGQTLVFVFTVISFGSSAPGIGVYVYADNVLQYVADPFLGVPSNCVPGNCTLTDGNYQALLPLGAVLYWGPDESKLVSPYTTIPFGNVVTIIDNDTAGWYHILWACEDYYIKAKNVSPNPAAVTKPFIAPKANK